MLAIINISKSFVNSSLYRKSHDWVLENLNLEIQGGEFFSLLGPSGCGKTTLLRLIAGLEMPTAGEIRFNGERIDTLPAQERPFHLVFQRYALFPHLNVYDNVAFGLRLKKVPEAEIKMRVEETLGLVSLPEFNNRWPETLSGGQQQRVALARALVNRPKMLLLDEPLSALDLKLREKMQTELKMLQRKTGITFIFVTHDQGEALALSDRLAVMNAGKIEQIGTPQEIYDKPASRFVADFVGESSFLREKDGVRMIRPGKLRFADSSSEGELVYEGTILQTLFRGTELELILQLKTKESLRFFVPVSEFQKRSLQSGETIKIKAARNECPFFKNEALV